MTAAEKVLALGWEDVVLFENFSYDDALVGVTEEGRAVYDYDKMVAWLVKTQGMTTPEAIEWVNYNTLGALPNAGDEGPLVMTAVYEEAKACTAVEKNPDPLPWDDGKYPFCNVCPVCGAIVERGCIKRNTGKLNYCPNCGNPASTAKA